MLNKGVIKYIVASLVAIYCNNSATLSMSTEIDNNILLKNITIQKEVKIKELKEDNIEFISTKQEIALGGEVVDYRDSGEKRRQEETRKQNEQKYVIIDVIVSYYTSLPEENGIDYSGMNAIGGYLSNTSVAIPRTGIIRYGMKLEFDNLSESYMADYNGKYLTRIADDCGSPKHIRVREDGVYRIDIYCPKFENESNKEYKKRVNNYGKYRTKCKVYIK